MYYCTLVVYCIKEPTSHQVNEHVLLYSSCVLYTVKYVNQ